MLTASIEVTKVAVSIGGNLETRYSIHLLRGEQAPPRYIAARTTNLEYPELINTGSSARLSDIRAPCSLRLSISPLSRRSSTLPTISRPFEQMESPSIASCLEMFPCSSARVSATTRTPRAHAVY